MSPNAVARLSSSFLLPTVTLLGLAGAALGQGSGPSPIARFELDRPTTDSTFLLQGVLPVRKATLPPGGAGRSFAFVDSDGELILAQVEVISRYASEDFGADVLELIAPVHVPSGSQPGDRLTYDVVLITAPLQPPVPAEETVSVLLDGTTPVSSAVADLVSNPNGIVLRSRDVYGNTYERRPFAETSYADVKKYGAHLTQVRSYDVMKPVETPAALGSSLPHLFGVHAYVTVREDTDVVLLDLRVHNGFANVNNRSELDDPLGEVYFDGLELEVPTGWELVRAFEDSIHGDPEFSEATTVHSLVAPRADGTLHWMPPSGQMIRRLALCPAGSEAEAANLLDLEGRAQVVEVGDSLWSWSHPDTSRYLSQNYPLPNLEHIGLQAIRDLHAAELSSLSQKLIDADVSSNQPLAGGQLGWATPFGVPYGGKTGGIGIDMYPGVAEAQARSASGLRLLQLTHRLQTDRQLNVLYRQDGNGTTERDWLVFLEDGAGLVPFNFYMGLIGTADPMGLLSTPTEQIEYAQAEGLAPDYQPALDLYQPHDLQHLIRYTGPLKALAWLMGDSLAIDDLLSQADLTRITYHPYLLQASGAMSPTGMLNDVLQAQANPGKGLAVDRGEAWAIDTRAAAYALGDDRRRGEEFTILSLLAETLIQGQIPCTGHFMAVTSSGVLGASYRAAQSYETSLLDHAIRGLLESVLREEQPGLATALEGFLASHYAGFVSDSAWSTELSGPRNQYAVAPIGSDSTPFCPGEQPAEGVSPTINGFQAWCTLAYAHRLTGDPIYLQRAAELAGGPLSEFLHQGGLTNLGNRAALLEVVQSP